MQRLRNHVSRPPLWLKYSLLAYCHFWTHSPGWFLFRESFRVTPGKIKPTVQRKLEGGLPKWASLHMRICSKVQLLFLSNLTNTADYPSCWDMLFSAVNSLWIIFFAAWMIFFACQTVVSLVFLIVSSKEKDKLCDFAKGCL